VQNVCYVIADEKFLCAEDGDLILLNEIDVQEFSLELIVKHKIKHHDGFDIQVMSVIPKNLDGFKWVGLRNFLGQFTEAEFQTAGRALQVLRWHFDHQFCGRCGNPTVQHTHDLAKTCEYCAIDFYPRLSPCIITLITRGDECLLAWHKRSKEERYSCLAGFIEVGENPEQTLEREVMEEVGLSVNNIRYVASQPWPFPGQLMLGYFADYANGDIRVDQDEIISAHWFRYDRLPTIPPASTISGQLISAFVERRKEHNSYNNNVAKTII